MRLLLDENVPGPMRQVVQLLIAGHDIQHVHDLPQWAGTLDVELYDRARKHGFEAVLTNDQKQMKRPDEVAAIAASGLHRIEYRHNNKLPGLVGLASAIATVMAGLPMALTELEKADSQRLVTLRSVDMTHQARMKILDPTREQLRHWPT